MVVYISGHQDNMNRIINFNKAYEIKNNIKHQKISEMIATMQYFKAKGQFI